MARISKSTADMKRVTKDALRLLVAMQAQTSILKSMVNYLLKKKTITRKNQNDETP